MYKFNFTTGYGDISFGLHAYPNPSEGIFSIEFTVEINNHYLYISDIQGKILRQFESTDKSLITIDISDLSFGSYMLYVYDPTEKVGNSHKIILSK